MVVEIRGDQFIGKFRFPLIDKLFVKPADDRLVLFSHTFSVVQVGIPHLAQKPDPRAGSRQTPLMANAIMIGWRLANRKTPDTV
jgi:hypothetical protein